MVESIDFWILLRFEASMSKQIVNKKCSIVMKNKKGIMTTNKDISKINLNSGDTTYTSGILKHTLIKFQDIVDPLFNVVDIVVLLLF